MEIMLTESNTLDRLCSEIMIIMLSFVQILVDIRHQESSDLIEYHQTSKVFLADGSTASSATSPMRSDEWLTSPVRLTKESS